MESSSAWLIVAVLIVAVLAQNRWNRIVWRRLNNLELQFRTHERLQDERDENGNED